MSESVSEALAFRLDPYATEFVPGEVFVQRVCALGPAMAFGHDNAGIVGGGYVYNGTYFYTPHYVQGTAFNVNEIFPVRGVDAQMHSGGHHIHGYGESGNASIPSGTDPENDSPTSKDMAAPECSTASTTAAATTTPANTSISDATNTGNLTSPLLNRYVRSDGRYWRTHGSGERYGCGGRWGNGRGKWHKRAQRGDHFRSEGFSGDREAKRVERRGAGNGAGFSKRVNDPRDVGIDHAHFNRHQSRYFR